MHIGIIGAGSIGMLIGSYLSEAGNQVTMLVRNVQQKESLNKEGISRLNHRGEKMTFSIYATTDYTRLADVNIVIIAVKYKDLNEVLKQLKNKQLDLPTLFIQNGIAHFYDLQEGLFSNVAFATVEHGALKKDSHTVSHNGVGKITIGVQYGQKDKFELLNQSQSENFPIAWHDQAAFILLRKVLVNCLINPLTTILGVRNGFLVDNQYGLELMKNLYDELIAAFPSMEESLSFEDVKNVCIQTANNESSMLTDFKNGRPMEIDTIVSALIAKAHRNKKKLPLLESYEKVLHIFNEQAAEK